MTRLACLIPAYNEGARIGAVLRVAVSHPDIAEVIVVDDGSRDDTAAVVADVAGRAPQLRLIRQPNRGKSAALATALRATDAPVVMFLDADLEGLDTEALEALIAPVRDGRAQVAISLRANAPRLWQAIGLDYISGERVVRRALIAPPEALERLTRFGVEVDMNARLVAAGARIAVVPWPGVKSPWKKDKYGLWQGLRADFGMIRDILRTIPAPRLARQIARMRAHRV